MCSAGKSVVQIYYSGSFIMLRACCKHCCHYADTLCCGSLPQRVTKRTDILSGWLISHQRSYGRGYCSGAHVNGRRLSLKLVKYWVRSTTSSGLHIQIPVKDDSFDTISKALLRFFCSLFLELRVFKALRLWTVDCFYSWIRAFSTVRLVTQLLVTIPTYKINKENSRICFFNCCKLPILFYG